MGTLTNIKHSTALLLAIGTIGTTTISVGSQLMKSTNILDNISLTAHADENNIPAKSLGVDVASYQGSDLTPFAIKGAKFAIAKSTEGTDYINPYFEDQVVSAKKNHMQIDSYHYGKFGANKDQAKQEATFALNTINGVISKGSYFAIDWETGATKDIEANTQAVMAFMRATKNAGYQPLLYTGAYYTKNLNLKEIIANFGNCLWIASYKTTDAQSEPDFNYFPSMDGVLMWQYSDKWNGMNVDGDVNVLPMIITPVNNDNSSSDNNNSSNQDNQQSNNQTDNNQSVPLTDEQINEQNKNAQEIVDKNIQAQQTQAEKDAVAKANTEQNANMTNNTQQQTATPTKVDSQQSSTPTSNTKNDNQNGDLADTSDSSNGKTIVGATLMTIFASVFGFTKLFKRHEEN